MELLKKAKRSISTGMSTTLLVAGALNMLFGFLATTKDPLECGIQIPGFEQIGHGMTGMLFFVFGFAFFMFGLTLLWLTPKLDHS